MLAGLKKRPLKAYLFGCLTGFILNGACLGDYEARLEREKLAESDDGQLTKLDDEIEGLLRQKRMLLTFNNMGYTDLRSEHAEVAESRTDKFNDELFRRFVEKVVIQSMAEVAFVFKVGVDVREVL